MIKVGQIYELDGKKIVITEKYYAIDRCDFIYSYGATDNYSGEYIEKYAKLIAEYPTWQEAVNSKEFKND